jgi:hypothetical protein
LRQGKEMEGDHDIGNLRENNILGGQGRETDVQGRARQWMRSCRGEGNAGMEKVDWFADHEL